MADFEHVNGPGTIEVTWLAKRRVTVPCRDSWDFAHVLEGLIRDNMENQSGIIPSSIHITYTKKGS